MIDITGQKFGMLTVIQKIDQRTSGQAMWLCSCDCGGEKTVASANLRKGNTKSCGCLQRGPDGKWAPRRSHGATIGGKPSTEYSSWYHMLQRCSNPNHNGWKNYGGRGIKVCDHWRKFENFLSDMGPKPTPKHSIDRYPDVNGNYEPGNCRWATRVEQNRNTRRQKQI